MLDQCHNIEEQIPAEIRSVMNVQEATAKALLVDRPALARAQQAGNVLGAHEVLMDAFSTDVRPLLRSLREDMGIDPDPLAAFARSDYTSRVLAHRESPGTTGWGQ
jgi:L-rhamnose isomerase/sugar isomerase